MLRQRVLRSDPAAWMTHPFSGLCYTACLCCGQHAPDASRAVTVPSGFRVNDGELCLFVIGIAAGQLPRDVGKRASHVVDTVSDEQRPIDAGKYRVRCRA
jgi:hypothetical protein